MKENNYIVIRDSIYQNLIDSPFTRGVSIINFWNFYGISIIKKVNGKFLTGNFKIFMTTEKIEYFLGNKKLGEYELNDYFLLDIKKYVNQILTHYIEILRDSYRKGKIDAAPSLKKSRKRNKKIKPT